MKIIGLVNGNSRSNKNCIKSCSATTAQENNKDLMILAKPQKKNHHLLILNTMLI